MTAAAAKGHTSKHTGTRKHRATSKHHATHQKKAAAGHTGHHVTTKATHAHHAKGRGFALASDLLPVCSLEAVTQSLRLLGQPVHDDEVAWLWELSGSRELSIPEALQAAVRFGLAGCAPVAVGVGQAQDFPHSLLSPVGVHLREVAFDEGVEQVFGHALILGVDRPGPHAVLATPAGWWSWGKLYDPWPCAIEEWAAVSWS